MPGAQKRLTELNALMVGETFWNNREQAQKLIDEANTLRNKIEPLLTAEKELEDFRVMVELGEAEPEAGQLKVQRELEADLTCRHWMPTSISYSALFIKNLYEPFYPGKSEKHKILVGKLVIPVTLAGGILVALYVDNLLELFKYIISVPAIFGAALWLGFIWRRLTKWAVIIQVVLCLFIYAIIPNLFLELDSFKYNEKLLKETNHKNVIIKTGALQSDVINGRAQYTGQVIEKQHTIAPVGIFFENVARINAVDVACLPVYLAGREIGRGKGLLFLGYYVAYVAYLILGAQQHDVLDEYSAIMISFVLPITIVTLVAMLFRDQQSRGAATGVDKD